MSSLGLTRSGAGLVPALQRGWVTFIEGVLQVHNDKIDTINDIAVDLRRPIVWTMRAAMVGALALVGLFVVELIKVCR